MDYQIVCTKQEPAQNPPQHAHIIAVGIGSYPTAVSQQFTLAKVIQMMDAGNRFYTRGPRTGKVAFVEKYWCPHCNKTYIHSSPDATTDNNLDSLRYCN